MTDYIIQDDLFGNSHVFNAPISRDNLTKLLIKRVKGISLERLVSFITNEFDETIEYIALQNGAKTCQKTSLLFNPHRLATRTKNSKAHLLEAFSDDRFLDGLSRAILFDQINRIKKGNGKDLLYLVLRLGINGVQYINEFPPHVARDLCHEHNLDAKSKVLDPCAGWGGRMIGVSTVCNNYDCFEPFTKTFYGLINLYKFIKSMNNNFDPEIHNIPFEDARLKESYYDFAVTSPPYYDTEIYTDEKNNSLNRYKTFESWVNGFYLPMISKTMKALKIGKSFILNIGSRNYPLNEILISEFGRIYKIKKNKSKLSGASGLGKSGEGESFYEIIK